MIIKNQRYSSQITFSLLLGICMTVSSCKLNSTIKNGEKDKQEGQKVVESLFDLVKVGRKNETYVLFSKEWMKLMDTAKTNEMFNRLTEKLGNIKKYELKNWQTVTTVGTDDSSYYAYMYVVEREKFNSEEQFRLIKENDSIKIISYHVNSSGLK